MSDSTPRSRHAGPDVDTGPFQPRSETYRSGTAHPDLEDLPLRPELANEHAYGAPQMDVPVALNVNENPYPPSQAVIADITEAVASASTGMNRYPDRDAVALRADLAGYLGHGLSAEQIWAANGSNEVMTHVLNAFGGPGRRVLGFTPSYSMYPEYARNTHTEWVTAARNPDFTLDIDHAQQAIATTRPDVLLVASPNNPTGTKTTRDQLQALCETAPGIVVIDEAYAEFAHPETPSALDLLPQFPRLAVVRTMSKAFAFAGGRLGYVAAAEAFVDALRIVRLPYHLSSVTQAVARAALAHAPALMSQVATLRQQRDELTDWLTHAGLQVAESDANFVLFGRFADRHAVFQGLLDQGVLIRETGPAGWLRISVGTPAEMSLFRDALAALLPEVEILTPDE